MDHQINVICSIRVEARENGLEFGDTGRSRRKSASQESTAVVSSGICCSTRTLKYVILCGVKLKLTRPDFNHNITHWFACCYVDNRNIEGDIKTTEAMFSESLQLFFEE